MSTLSIVCDLHTEIEQWLKKNAEKVQENEPGEKSGINACADFVLLFSQFERIIDAFFEEIVGPGEDDTFIHKVNVVSGKLSRSVASDIFYYYEIRCDIAHGRNMKGIPFSLNSAHGFFNRIAEDLRIV